MDNVLIERVIFWGLWGFAMAVVMAWVARGRMRPLDNADGDMLQHPTNTLIVGVMCVLMFLGAEILSIIFDNGTTNLFTHVVFISLTLLGLFLIGQYFFEKHHVTSDGLHFYRYTGGHGRLKWADVVEIRYDPVCQWFRLKTKDGDVARISGYLKGLPEFARAALAHTPRAAFDDDIEIVLRDAARGILPAFWN